MNLEKEENETPYKWYFVFVLLAIIVVSILIFTTDIFQASGSILSGQLVIVLGALIFLIAVLVILSKVIKIFDALRDNSKRMEELTAALEKIHSGLAQINHSTRISETAKAIAFRDADRQSLRQAVFEKLQAQDFDAALELTDEISMQPEYVDLAQELQVQVDKYRNATHQERLNQMIANIEKLFDECQWIKASTQIEGMIRAYPESEQAKAMRQTLLNRKLERKKILLAAWDDAIQNRETDRSLEILKELDQYLSSNEASALQEAASDVFRTKLHNLGMQFSMSVTERRWAEALDIGEKIMQDFPNSKMSEEIYSKMEILRRNVQMQNT
jgi:hypothetical protein